MEKIHYRDSGIQLCSIILVIGGALGLYVVYSFFVEFLKHSNAASILLISLIGILFLWSVWTGIRLWRASPGSIKWAKILFLIQIPVLYVSGIGYEFYLLFNVLLQFGTESVFSYNIGTAFDITLGENEEPNHFGINIVALVCLLHLLFGVKTEPAESKQAV